MIPSEPLRDVVLIAVGATFVLLFWDKIGARESLQLHATRIYVRFKALPSCDFCMLFWLCFLISIPVAAISNIFYLAAAVLSSPIALALYATCRGTRIK
jgi:hypothetical protein